MSQPSESPQGEFPAEQLDKAIREVFAYWSRSRIDTCWKSRGLSLERLWQEAKVGHGSLDNVRYVRGSWPGLANIEKLGATVEGGDPALWADVWSRFDALLKLATSDNLLELAGSARKSDASAAKERLSGSTAPREHQILQLSSDGRDRPTKQAKRRWLLAVAGVLAVVVGAFTANRLVDGKENDQLADRGTTPVVHDDPATAGRDVSRLPISAGAVGYSDERLLLPAMPSSDDNVEVNFDVPRVGEPDGDLRNDDLYYRFLNDKEKPDPTFVVRMGTWLAVIDDAHADGAACLNAIRHRIVERSLPLAAGQHLCVLTEHGLIVRVDVNEISSDGEVALLASAWESERDNA